MKRYLPFAIITGVLIAALAGGAIYWRAANKTPDQPFTEPKSGATPSVTPNSSQTPSPTSSPGANSNPTGPDRSHFRGGANAKVTLEEYGDYQCPPCGILAPELKSIEKEYGDKIRFVFRHYPLQIHKHAFVAAYAAEAAGLQGQFWEMHDMIYQNQMSWSVADDARPVFIQYARMLKLDIDRFTRDMDSPEIKSIVKADFDRGKSVGVEGTPTVLINGRELRPEVVTPDGLRVALNFMLGKK